jgi:hypothetical protein
MLAVTLDKTTDFNLNNGVKLDVSGWQNITIQATGSLSGTISITGSIDGGGITGISEGSPKQSVNYTAVTATNQATGTGLTAITVAGNYTITNPPKYIQIGGASAATTGKLIIYLTTPV